MNLDERMADCCINPPSEAKARIEQLIRDVLAEVKPERSFLSDRLLDMPEGHDAAHDACIGELEANIKRLGL